jgi:hypothetical protein
MLEGWKNAFNEAHLILVESGSIELLRSIGKPITESMTSTGVTAAGIVLATILVDSVLTKPTLAKRKMARQHRLRLFGPPRHARRFEDQEFTLKGRNGQVIGKVRMNKGQRIEDFMKDLERLNQIHRGRHSGASVEFEIRDLESPLTLRAGNFNHYSPFVGHFLFDERPLEVSGIAKFRKRGKTLFSEVEFDSDLGHFRIELPHQTGLLQSTNASKGLCFKIEIGCATLNLV